VSRRSASWGDEWANIVSGSYLGLGLGIETEHRDAFIFDPILRTGLGPAEESWGHLVKF
jgi:hypothetical protein